jgi:Kef-type K+ transport system membrane component KefB
VDGQGRADEAGATTAQVALTYGVLVGVTVAGVLLVWHLGAALTAPTGGAGAEVAAIPATSSHVLLRLLVALTAVIVTAQVLARVLALVRQPPVIGEILAGILLGPSFIGADASAWILPPDVAPYLGAIAQLGVVLYMFLVGLELHGEALRHRMHALVTTSHASILVPFLMGAALALVLYPRVATTGVPFTAFALFMGVAMSITAFPVLARILTDHGMAQTPIGVTALTCAALNDLTAWCLLALVIGVVQAQVGNAMWVAGGALAYVAFMVLVARPLLARWTARSESHGGSSGAVALLFIALLTSALVTEAIGIHAVFGAFALGALVPHDSAIARGLTNQLRHVVTILLLPAFFAFTGMRTRIDLLAGAGIWLLCGLIIVVATAGKFGGTFFAARFTGSTWRDAAVLGALMNTRGLMELIVLNIGLELGVISPTLFAMMVIMAIVTTVAASPALVWLMPRPRR